MNWIQTHYDRALLIGASVIALGGSALVIMKAGSFRDSLAVTEKPASSNLPPLDQAPIDSALKRIAEPATWQRPKLGEFKTVPLLASSPFVAKNDTPTEAFDMLAENAPKLRDPIDNAWLVINNLDFTSINVKEQDPDGDGYTNLDEYLAKTDPQSSLSTPSFESKLYYVERVEHPLSIKFSAYDGGTCSIAVISQDDTGKETRATAYLKVGDTTKDGRFRIDDVKMEVVERFGTQTQVAVATISDLKNPSAEKIRVEQGKAVDHPSYSAKFVYSLTNESFVKKVNEDIEITKPAALTLTVAEIHADNAVLKYISPKTKQEVKMKKDLTAAPK